VHYISTRSCANGTINFNASNKKLYEPYPIKSITKKKLSDLMPNLIPFITGQEHFEVLHN